MPMAYAESFHEGVFIQWHMVDWWSFVFGVRCLWRHSLTSYSCLQTNILAKFVDIICIFFYTNSPYFMFHCTEYKLLALQVRISEVNTLNATTQNIITAKISGCALKQGSKTHSPMRQSNLQLQSETAVQCLVEYEQSSIEKCGWPCWRTTPFERLNLAKLHRNWECA